MTAERSLDDIAAVHLRCGHPSQPCDPWEAALEDEPGGGLRTLRLARAIEGYHNPNARLLIAAAEKALTQEQDR